MLDDPLFYLAAIPAVVVLGMSKGGFAGAGLLAQPLLSLYVPPLQAAAILLPILLSQDGLSMWTYRRTWDAWILKVMLPGAVAGIALAAAVAVYIPDSAVRLLVGIISLAFVLNSWFGKPRTEAKPRSAPAAVVWGAASGFTSTLAQAGSPPFQIYVLPLKLDKFTFVGTSVIFFGTLNAMKVVPYFFLGQFSTASLTTSAVMLPLAVASNFLGVWLVRITPAWIFFRIAYVLVFVISVLLIGQGLYDLAR